VTPPRISRARPRAHDGRSGSETAIFAATEALLTETTLQDLTVAQIIARAGISRANFYHYFASKFDVLAALVARLLEDVYTPDESWSAPAGKERAGSLEASMAGTVELWSAHGAVICAAIEHMYTVPQIGEAWFAVREQLVQAVAGQIEYERSHGRAGAGAPADMVATMLLCALERTFYVGTRGLDARILTPTLAAAAIDELTARALIGRVTPDPEAAGPRPHEQTGLPEPTDTAGGILQAVGRLVCTTSLEELSVATIADAAETSRATFYFYFASKEDAFAALFGQIAEPFVHLIEQRVSAEDPTDLGNLVLDWMHGDEVALAVVRNTVHEWPRRPELAKVYLAAADRIEEALGAAIAANRGHVAGAGAGELAAALWWTVENTFAGALAAEGHLADAEGVARMLGDLLVATVFGVSPAVEEATR
jgi:AcrR family transcriptional regulator